MANQSAMVRLIQTKMTTIAASPDPMAPIGWPAAYRPFSQGRARSVSRGFSNAALARSAAAGTK